MKVKNPKQSSFEDDKLVSVMLSADVAGALGHEVVLLVQLHHGTVKVAKILVPVVKEKHRVSRVKPREVNRKTKQQFSMCTCTWSFKTHQGVMGF